jgi:hemolysin activation/secretion protein
MSGAARIHRSSAQAFGRLLSLPLALLAGAPACVWAAPDAGSVLQQIEARPGGLLNAPRLQTPQVPTPPAAGQGAALLRVNGFRIEGHSLVDAQTLQEALKGFAGRELSLTQLQEAAWVLVQTYREAGWLAHAFVPQQEIEQGLVTLRVVEARLGQVRMEYPAQTQLPRGRIEAMSGAHLQAGQPIALRQVDRLLLLLGDLPGVVATASYAAGKQDGSTDVLLTLAPEKRFAGNLLLDNHGSVSTGTSRLSANLALNNATGWADGLQLQTLKTEGNQYARAAWTLPLGAQGWRGGVHLSDLRYRLVGSFAALRASGSASTWGLDLNAPLIRQPGHNLSLQLSTDRKDFDNRALSSQADAQASTTSSYRIDVLRAALSGNWLDALGKPAQNSASVQASWGKVDLDGSPNALADAQAARTAGSFQKLNASFSREQSLFSQTSAYLQGSAQWASRNLDSSEKLYLGGANGVRAYPSNEAGGSVGSTLSAGLRQRLGQGFVLNAFADWGRVQVYQDNRDAAGSAITTLNNQTLKGVGLGLSWRAAQGHELSATWSRRVGHNPAANASTGADSDGTRNLNRFWLSAALNF